MRTDFVVPGEYAQLDTGSTKLAFAAYALGEQNFAGRVCRAASEGQPPNMEVAPLHADVDGRVRTRARGLPRVARAAPRGKPQGQRVADVRDPFGTLVELATPL